MKKNIASVIVHLLVYASCAPLTAQTVKGTVVDERMDVLIGATVTWMGTAAGTTTDDMGDFSINGEDITDKRLEISYVGYQTQTLDITGDANFFIQLQPDARLGEVVVEDRQTGSFISSNSTSKIEVINEAELTQAACCDLAGCFNNNASVEPATSNVITNAKELKILGLSGVYNQLLLDGHPLIQGLSFTYGVSAVPGPMVRNIFIAKGTNSVLQGAESISGQINVILQEPDGKDKLLLNAYANIFGESQYNAYGRFKIGQTEHWMGGHVAQPGFRMDRNGDGFLDAPLLARYEMMDKIAWRKTTDNGWSAKGGARYTNERRIGGQKEYDTGKDLGSGTIYGQRIGYDQVDVWGRTQFRMDKKNATSLIGSGQLHDQSAWYGETHYEGRQWLLNATLRHEFIYKNGSNLRAGASFKYLDLAQDISFTNNPLGKSYDGSHPHLERIPGLFAENTYFSKNNQWTTMLGVRADHLNGWGWEFSPRMLVKYTTKTKGDFRMSAGYGWHIPKVFAEQSRVLSTQRDIHFHSDLNPDRAWNYGISWVQKFEADKISGTFNMDYYHTHFLNHVQPHYHRIHDAIVFENNTEKATGHGFQVQLSLEIGNGLTIKNAYNFLDMRHRDIETNELKTMDFVVRHKFQSSISVAPRGKPWHFDVTARWHGRKQLPFTGYYPSDFRQPTQSRPYTMLNAQFSYDWKRFEWYAGAENILHFRQKAPIVSADNPFNSYFDTSFAWGPVRGVEGYIGFRYRLKRE